MKQLLLLGAITTVLGLGIAGCSNTAEGMKEDTSNAGKSVEQATDKTVDATKDAAKNTTAALEVTPRVKTAIVADSKLNDPRNRIDVDSKDGIVHLKGHVVNNDMKRQAGAVAEKTLKDSSATDKVSNELTVESH